MAAEYSANADRPQRVVCFDTDLTISYADGPVPLEHVIALREEPTTSVWATGYNQTLREEAGIPGMPELRERRDRPATEPIERADRMRMLQAEYPDAASYTVVDDVDLRELEPEGWIYYHPGEYAVEVLDLMPNEWPDASGVRFSEYMEKVGSFAGHLPAEELDFTTERPRAARVAAERGDDTDGQ